jgi:hypothetical protein
MHRLIVLILTVMSLTSYAQLPDVPAAFNAINTTTPEVLHLKKNHIKIPSGGHLQGIQALSDSIIVVTGSSSSYSYYLTADKTQLTSIRKISDAPFRHAGGCQVFGDHLAVGVEDNKAKDKSNIVDVLLDKKGTEYSRGIVIERKGVFKRSTAGAVGEIFTDTTYNWVMAVADWDSRNIDFYYSVGDSSAITGWAADLALPKGHHWPSYQSINLLTDTAGKLYLIGFALDGLKNRADLFEVTIHRDNAELKLLSTRNFKCRGTSFRYGSGIYINEAHQLHIYSCPGNVTRNTAINIFR